MPAKKGPRSGKQRSKRGIKNLAPPSARGTRIKGGGGGDIVINGFKIEAESTGYVRTKAPQNSPLKGQQIKEN